MRVTLSETIFMGTEHFQSNGDVYEGAWKYGEITGFGTFTWKNGDKYVGDFVNGEFTEMVA